MNDGLIINARQHLSWYVRLFSDAGTAAMWMAWLYLLRPVGQMFVWLHSWSASFRAIFSKILTNTPALTIESSVLALLGTSATLLLWSLLPSKRVEMAHQINSMKDYAAHFQLPEQQIVEGRKTSVCVVHHDEMGNITHIETVGKLAS